GAHGVLGAQRGACNDRVQVQADILGPIRQLFFNRRDKIHSFHLLSGDEKARQGLFAARGPKILLREHDRRRGGDYSVSPPTVRLQGHSSSVCRPSSRRRISSGLRPTFRLLTDTCWMTLSGSTMKVARRATPSFLSRTPSWSTSEPVVSPNW